MMDRRRFEQFRAVLAGMLFGVAGLGLLSSCATANTKNNSAPISELKPPPVDVLAELSSTEAEAGSLVLVKVTLSTHRKGKPISGSFEGIELPFFEAPELGEGVFAAALAVPYERSPGPGSVTVQMGEGEDVVSFQIPISIKEGQYKSEVLRVDGRRVNPTNKKDLIRIKAEQAEVAELYKRITLKKYWSGPFIYPIQSRITSPFGTKRIYNGQLKNFHPGLDLKAPMRTRVYSAAPGVVVMAKNLFYTGNTVMIDHGYGIITLYAHMSRIGVKVGQVLKAHELLGLSGKTGRVNGPHLHWQAVVHRVKVNPLGLIQVIR